MIRALSAFLAISLLCITNSYSGQPTTYGLKYLEKHKELAIRNMTDFAIPASITLAQAMLESDYGRSHVAVKGNNHFGIKALGGWKGDTVRRDDNHLQEVFRAYPSVEHSYTAHSRFLTQKSRYSPLFSLHILDYKGWAKGLRAAGYATATNYPSMLLNLIETYNLATIDSLTLAKMAQSAVPVEVGVGGQMSYQRTDMEEPQSVGGDQNLVNKINNVKFVLAADGDTYSSIATQYKIKLKKLLEYNDLPVEIPLKQGERVFLGRKKSKSSETYIHLIEKSSEDWRSVAQLYGIRVDALQKLNPKLDPSLLKLGNIVELQ